MRQDFAPGDVVVIRDWDDMMNEYGRDHSGMEIDKEGLAFVSGMAHLCGREVTIREVTKTRLGRPRLIFEENLGGWSFSPGMVRLVERPGDIDSEEFEKLLYEGD